MYVHSAICENLQGVVVFHRSMVNWRKGDGEFLPGIDVHSAICETFLV